MVSQKLPNLIIAGVNRAGTTSLFTYLSRHTDICASTIKETNYFMPVFYNRNLSPIDEYISYFKRCNIKSKYLMEASPRYIVGGETIARTIYKKLGSIKVIFLLRDPIRRLFSYYKQRKASNEFSGKILFDEYVDRAVKGFNDLKNNNKHNNINVYNVNVYIRGLAEGFYYDYLTQWYDIFGDSIKVYFFEDLKTKPILFMKEISNWLEIDPAIYKEANLSIENKSVNCKSKKLHNLASAINEKFEGFFRSHYSLKKSLRNIYYLLNESSKKKEVITEKTLKNLETLYEPYNKRLFYMLYSKGYLDFPEWLRKYS